MHFCISLLNSPRRRKNTILLTKKPYESPRRILLSQLYWKLYRLATNLWHGGLYSVRSCSCQSWPLWRKRYESLLATQDLSCRWCWGSWSGRFAMSYVLYLLACFVCSSAPKSGSVRLGLGIIHQVKGKYDLPVCRLLKIVIKNILGRCYVSIHY